MKIGIGTYSLFWELQDRNPQPLSIQGMINRAAQLGCDVFQICDHPRIESESLGGLRSLRERAELKGIELEVGTRTIGRDHLLRYLDIAEALGARTLRSMIQPQEIEGGADTAGGTTAAAHKLRAALPRLEETGITIALETYEQLPTWRLLAILDEVDSPLIGVCLDPANCVSALEHPKDVVESCASRTVNIHVKDFAFTRQEGSVGFTYSGAPLGDGLLDLEHELTTVYDSTRFDGRPAPSAIVEHWVPWQGDLETTVTTERAWTDRALAALRTWRANHAR